MERKTALLITGGGSRGIIQYGYLEAFIDSKLPYDAIYAGSVGALNALLFAQNQMEDLRNIWLTIQNKDVYKPRILSLWKLLTNDASLYESSPLAELIDKYVDMSKLETFPKPIYVNVTNLSTMQSECRDIRKLPYKDVVQWILASASPPILFPTVTINGEEHCDTGILNNFFITQAINDGYDNLICMTPTNYKNRPIKTVVDVIQSVISTSSFGYLGRESQAVEEMNKELVANGDADKTIKLVVIRPPAPWDQGLVDFNYKEDRRSLIQYGYNICREKLRELV